MQVCATINNFWMGGRETFLVEHARELAGRGIGTYLLAGNLSASPEMFRAFQGTACAKRGLLRGCLEAAWDPAASLVWGQHFDLLGPWILARVRNIPLHTTFHGPLVGAGRPNSLMEALGMTLAITRGEGLSGVSEEVVTSVRAVAPEVGDVRIFRNATPWVRGASFSGQPVRKGRALLITRSEKLGHLRAGFDLFSRAMRKGVLSRLTVIAAGAPGRDPLEGGATAAARLLGRSWCASLGPRVIPALAATRIVPAAAHVSGFLEDCDVVMGMGRVIIEGIARDKVCVLLGYENAIDVVDGSNFSQFASSNFSGRGMDPLLPDTVVSRLGTHRKLPTEVEMIPFGIADAVTKVEAAFRADCEKTVRNRELAALLEGALREKASDATIFQLVCRNLQPTELETLFRLSKG